MNTIISILQVLEYGAAFTVFIFGTFFAINRMSGCTKHCMRVAWVLLTGGAMAVFLWPSIAHVLTLTGVALFVVADKRRCWDCSTSGEVHMNKVSKIEWL